VRYPFWLTYPKAWLQTTLLFFSCLFVYAIQYPLIRWMDAAFTISDIWYDYQDLVVTYTYPVLFILIVLPIFILSHIHQFFWGEPLPNLPRVIPAPKSLLRGFVDWIFNVLGLIMAVSLWINWIYRYRYFPYYTSNKLTEAIIISWFIIVAYFYHFWFFLGRRYQRIQEKFTKTK
jgi:hypothetical protein